jgi:hypothetical protein
MLIVYVRADHELRPEVSLFQWFGMSLDEKTFLAIANALLLNSILFLGEFAQIICGMRTLDFEFDLLSFKNLIMVKSQSPLTVVCI